MKPSLTCRSSQKTILHASNQISDKDLLMRIIEEQKELLLKQQDVDNSHRVSPLKSVSSTTNPYRSRNKQSIFNTFNCNNEEDKPRENPERMN